MINADNISYKAALTCIIIVLSLSFHCSMSFAATFNVSTTVQLRKALEDAAANNENDTIILEAGTYKTSADSKGTFIFSDYRPQNLVLKAKDGLTSDDVVLDGSGQSQVLSFYNSGNTLERLSVINGFNGVYTSKNSKLNIIKCNISNNDGRGIYGDDGSVLTVSDSTVQDNVDAGIYGGNAEGAGRMVVINSTVSGNGYEGIVNKGSAPGPVIVINSIITGHTEKGIYGWNGSGALYVLNSVISGNVDGIWGKGVFVNIIFQNNSGRDIYLLSNSSYFESRVYNDYIDYKKLDNEASHTIVKKNNIQPGDGALKFSDAVFRPALGSDAIDKGLSPNSSTFKDLFSDSSLLAIALGGLSKDRDGNQRTIGTAIDMGAYEYVPLYDLTITISGTGKGTVSATGLSCSDNVCTGMYSSGFKVTLTAKPDFGSSFAGWDSKCTGTGQCRITMEDNTALTATFDKQEDVVCPYALATNKKTFSASGNTGSVKVKTESICTWTATSNADWIAVSSGGSGTGNGTVNYSVTSNTSPGSRTGTMTVAGKTFTITQQGLPDLSATWSKITQKRVKAKYRIAGTLAVTNAGGSTAAGVKAKIYLSADETLDENDALLSSKPVAIGTVRANGKIVKSLVYFTLANPSGKHLIAVIDPDNLIVEANEADNTAGSAVP